MTVNWVSETNVVVEAMAIKAHGVLVCYDQVAEVVPPYRVASATRNKSLK